jgi:hypothetical protein
MENEVKERIKGLRQTELFYINMEQSYYMDEIAEATGYFKENYLFVF